MSQYNTEEEDDKLQLWLLNTIDAQFGFVERAAAAGYQLSTQYLVESLDELERYALDNNVHFDDTSGAGVNRRIDCWFYLGATFIKRYGGYWVVSDNEANPTHLGRYVIGHFHADSELEFDASGMLARFLRRRLSGMLRRAVETFLAPPLDLSHLPTESEPRN